MGPRYGLRFEIKKILSFQEYMLLRERISVLLEKDVNMQQEDGYKVSSLYFDYIYQSAYYEKINGVKNRKKYRIRIYNDSDQIIHLECKEKHSDKIAKRAILISKECALEMIRSDYSILSHQEDELSQEVYAAACSRKLMPKVIVNYKREAYVYEVSNVRITFDKDLSCVLNSKDLFAEDYLETSVFDHQQVILEIKYDTYLPKFIAQAVEGVGYKTAVSKFCHCIDQKEHYIMKQ